MEICLLSDAQKKSELMTLDMMDLQVQTFKLSSFFFLKVVWPAAFKFSNLDLTKAFAEKKERTLLKFLIHCKLRLM